MFDVVTQIEIDAPPETAWSVLTDFAAVPTWNDFIRQIRGEVREGAWLEVTARLKGAPPMNFRPKVRVVRPSQEFRWRGHLVVPTLFSGEHYFLFERNGSGGTLLTHGEHFEGLLARLLRPRLVPRVEASFDAFNRDFKARVESAQRAGAT
ncbi:MAG: SRPBCC domain-containing protein [Enhydrobacter sp.]|nr:MAG: SRPBCC domain-containing protein [Enhydrobacter sp.]